MSKKPFAARPIAYDTDEAADARAAEDRAIEGYAKKAGIPELVTPSSAPAVAAEEQVKLTVMVPKSVAEQLKLNWAQGRGTQRYQVLKGLSAGGFVELDETLLIEDRRAKRSG